MKVFFDSNIYIAEALLGRAAERMIRATRRARWRIFTSHYIVHEVSEVLTLVLRFSHRLASLTSRRILRRAALARIAKQARVPRDPDDSPVLQAALGCGADYLVTNDRHLLELDPYKGLRIISMSAYHQLLQGHGHLGK